MLVRLVSTTRCHSSSGSSTASATMPCIPATLTSTSIPPSASATSSAIRRTSPESDTSAWKNRALPPPRLMSSATASPVFAFTSTAATDAPSAANSLAVASPMPWPAPVTMATRPSICMAIGCLRPAGSRPRVAPWPGRERYIMPWYFVVKVLATWYCQSDDAGRFSALIFERPEHPFEARLPRPEGVEALPIGLGPGAKLQQRVHHRPDVGVVAVEERRLGLVDAAPVVVAHERRDLLVRLRLADEAKLQVAPVRQHPEHAVVDPLVEEYDVARVAVYDVSRDVRPIEPVDVLSVVSSPCSDSGRSVSYRGDLCEPAMSRNAPVSALSVLR